MTVAQMDEPMSQKALRLWPGVVAVVLQWVGFLLPRVAPEAGIYGMLGAAFFGLVVVVWWLFFSRAPWFERVGAIVLMPAAVLATKLVVHPSIANAGMGMMLYFFAIPVLCLVLVAWAAATRRFSAGPRRASLVAATLLGCGVFTLLRTGGVSGEGHSDFHWRWTPTPEERLLAEAGDEPAPLPSVPAPAGAHEEAPAAAPAKPATATAPSVPAAAHSKAPAAAVAGASAPTAVSAPAPEPTGPEWPGFRGSGRDGVIHGARIQTDWSASPPVQLWKRPIGPGWSSFAVRDDLLYTQEQRGDDEIVACYRLTTGEPVWRHRDAARFWESNGGPGPRGTPTLSNGRVYALGATGILNALDAKSGALVWSRNAVTDTGAKIPGWGIASSPLVVDDLVIVAASGRLGAYEVATGKPRWFHPTGGGSYSSPHLMTIGGVAQVLLLSGTGATSVAPADGVLLWEHAWTGVPILQPARAGDGDVLIAAGDMTGGMGTRRLAVAHGASGWTASERWTSLGLKPYFNDFVVHLGHAFGFDGSILACIDLADGKRKWKGGRYGHGQLVLLAEQGLLLVLSEEGELALVKATPDEFTEVARVAAIEGKTWNHPALIGDLLLVRNGQEMAAFRLSLTGG